MGRTFVRKKEEGRKEGNVRKWLTYRICNVLPLDTFEFFIFE